MRLLKREMVHFSSGEQRRHPAATEGREGGMKKEGVGFSFNDTVCIYVANDRTSVSETFLIQRVGSPSTFQQYKYSPT